MSAESQATHGTGAEPQEAPVEGSTSTAAAARLVIPFLRHEIAATASLLGEASTVLGEEFEKLRALSPDSGRGVARIAEAMQHEDLVQQRLADVGAALGVLAKRLDRGAADDNRGDELGSEVAASLRLGDLRERLLCRMNGEQGRAASRADTDPGKVDLF